MALKSLVFDKKGTCFLNSLKRFALSGIIVPQQNLTIAKIPQAQSLTQPGRSHPIPIQGPNDASTEVYSFTGKQGLVNQGIGVITSDGATSQITGTGTKFLTQIQAGDYILIAGFTFPIVSVNSDTNLTTAAPITAVTNSNYFFYTPILTAFDQGSGANVFVSITDQAWRRRLMNRDVPVIHVFGDNQKPLYLKESLLLEQDQTLVLEFTNYSTTEPASFAPIMEGRKWQKEALNDSAVYNFIGGLRDRKQFAQPYWLTMDKGRTTLAIGASTNEFFTCTGDITLFLFNLYGQAFADDGSDVSNLVTVQFVDAKTQRAIQAQPMPLSTIAGTSQNPMRLPTPWIVEPQTQIRATFQNNSGVACKAYVTFHGVAIYTGSSWRGSTLTNKHLMKEGQRMYKAMSVPQVRPAEPQ